LVHIFCKNEKCRKIFHLDDHKYWDFEGKVKCKHCGKEMVVEISKGELKKSKK
jgi:hypothetical protein